ncbi:E3 ubiquitin-protein ligase, putative [Plasmodium chabaudi adami]|uniref:HECT-type E3 ubiquitin transferase n=1 Tax=Plasmodium chabaudi adami TaxID=5826 RepID=A0A1D3RSW2_PLACE|nr:E3 ubiquitin-protein ligase, putative [Plasmodium chabaudi adami]
MKKYMIFENSQYSYIINTIKHGNESEKLAALNDFYEQLNLSVDGGISNSHLEEYINVLIHVINKPHASYDDSYKNTANKKASKGWGNDKKLNNDKINDVVGNGLNNFFKIIQEHIGVYGTSFDDMDEFDYSDNNNEKARRKKKKKKSNKGKDNDENNNSDNNKKGNKKLLENLNTNEEEKVDKADNEEEKGKDEMSEEEDDEENESEENDEDESSEDNKNKYSSEFDSEFDSSNNCSSITSECSNEFDNEKMFMDEACAIDVKYINMIYTATCCIYTILDIYPNSIKYVINNRDCVNILNKKLNDIEYIDVAEVILKIFEKLVEKDPMLILKKKSIKYMLMHIDFYNVNIQKKIFFCIIQMINNIKKYKHIKKYIMPYCNTYVNFFHFNYIHILNIICTLWRSLLDKIITIQLDNDNKIRRRANSLLLDEDRIRNSRKGKNKSTKEVSSYLSKLMEKKKKTKKKKKKKKQGGNDSNDNEDKSAMKHMHTKDENDKSYNVIEISDDENKSNDISSDISSNNKSKKKKNSQKKIASSISKNKKSKFSENDIEDDHGCDKKKKKKKKISNKKEKIDKEDNANDSYSDSSCSQKENKNEKRKKTKKKKDDIYILDDNLSENDQHIDKKEQDNKKLFTTLLENINESHVEVKGEENVFSINKIKNDETKRIGNNLDKGKEDRQNSKEEKNKTNYINNQNNLLQNIIHLNNNENINNKLCTEIESVYNTNIRDNIIKLLIECKIEDNLYAFIETFYIISILVNYSNNILEDFCNSDFLEKFNELFDNKKFKNNNILIIYILFTLYSFLPICKIDGSVIHKYETENLLGKQNKEESLKTNTQENDIFSNGELSSTKCVPLNFPVDVKKEKLDFYKNNLKYLMKVIKIIIPNIYTIFEETLYYDTKYLCTSILLSLFISLYKISFTSFNNPEFVQCLNYIFSYNTELYSFIRFSVLNNLSDTSAISGIIICKIVESLVNLISTNLMYKALKEKLNIKSENTTNEAYINFNMNDKNISIQENDITNLTFSNNKTVFLHVLINIIKNILLKKKREIAIQDSNSLCNSNKQIYNIIFLYFYDLYNSDCSGKNIINNNSYSIPHKILYNNPEHNDVDTSKNGNLLFFNYERESKNVNLEFGTIFLCYENVKKCKNNDVSNIFLKDLVIDEISCYNNVVLSYYYLINLFYNLYRMREDGSIYFYQYNIAKRLYFFLFQKLFYGNTGKKHTQYVDNWQENNEGYVLKNNTIINNEEFIYKEKQKKKILKLLKNIDRNLRLYIFLYALLFVNNEKKEDIVHGLFLNSIKKLYNILGMVKNIEEINKSEFNNLKLNILKIFDVYHYNLITNNVSFYHFSNLIKLTKDCLNMFDNLPMHFFQENLNSINNCIHTNINDLNTNNNKALWSSNSDDFPSLHQDNYCGNNVLGSKSRKASDNNLAKGLKQRRKNNKEDSNINERADNSETNKQVEGVDLGTNINEKKLDTSIFIEEIDEEKKKQKKAEENEPPIFYTLKEPNKEVGINKKEESGKDVSSTSTPYARQNSIPIKDKKQTKGNNFIDEKDMSSVKNYNNVYYVSKDSFYDALSKNNNISTKYNDKKGKCMYNNYNCHFPIHLRRNGLYVDNVAIFNSLNKGIQLSMVQDNNDEPSNNRMYQEMNKNGNNIVYDYTKEGDEEDKSGILSYKNKEKDDKNRKNVKISQKSAKDLKINRMIYTKDMTNRFLYFSKNDLDKSKNLQGSFNIFEPFNKVENYIRKNINKINKNYNSKYYGKNDDFIILSINGINVHKDSCISEYLVKLSDLYYLNKNESYINEENIYCNFENFYVYNDVVEHCITNYNYIKNNIKYLWNNNTYQGIYSTISTGNNKNNNMHIINYKIIKKRKHSEQAYDQAFYDDELMNINNDLNIVTKKKSKKKRDNNYDNMDEGIQKSEHNTFYKNDDIYSYVSPSTYKQIKSSMNTPFSCKIINDKYNYYNISFDLVKQLHNTVDENVETSVGRENGAGNNFLTMLKEKAQKEACEKSKSLYHEIGTTQDAYDYKSLKHVSGQEYYDELGNEKIENEKKASPFLLDYLKNCYIDNKMDFEFLENNYVENDSIYLSTYLKNEMTKVTELILLDNHYINKDIMLSTHYHNFNVALDNEKNKNANIEYDSKRSTIEDIEMGRMWETNLYKKYYEKNKIPETFKNTIYNNEEINKESNETHQDPLFQHENMTKPAFEEEEFYMLFNYMPMYSEIIKKGVIMKTENDAEWEYDQACFNLNNVKNCLCNNKKKRKMDRDIFIENMYNFLLYKILFLLFKYFKIFNTQPLLDFYMSNDIENKLILDENKFESMKLLNDMTKHEMNFVKSFYLCKNNRDNYEEPNKLLLDINKIEKKDFILNSLNNKIMYYLNNPLFMFSEKLPSWIYKIFYLFNFVINIDIRSFFFEIAYFGNYRGLYNYKQRIKELVDKFNEKVTTRNGALMEEHLLSVCANYTYNSEKKKIFNFLQDNTTLSLPRTKIKLHRHKIVDSSFRIFNHLHYINSNYVTPSYLDIEFFNEEGTGLGPSLEFYNEVIEELKKEKLKLFKIENNYLFPISYKIDLNNFDFNLLKKPKQSELTNMSNNSASDLGAAFSGNLHNFNNHRTFGSTNHNTYNSSSINKRMNGVSDGVHTNSYHSVNSFINHFLYSMNSNIFNKNNRNFDNFDDISKIGILDKKSKNKKNKKSGKKSGSSKSKNVSITDINNGSFESDSKKKLKKKKKKNDAEEEGEIDEDEDAEEIKNSSTKMNKKDKICQESISEKPKDKKGTNNQDNCMDNYSEDDINKSINMPDKTSSYKNNNGFDIKDENTKIYEEKQINTEVNKKKRGRSYDAENEANEEENKKGVDGKDDINVKEQMDDQSFDEDEENDYEDEEEYGYEIDEYDDDDYYDEYSEEYEKGEKKNNLKKNKKEKNLDNKGTKNTQINEIAEKSENKYTISSVSSFDTIKKQKNDITIKEEQSEKNKEAYEETSKKMKKSKNDELVTNVPEKKIKEEIKDEYIIDDNKRKQTEKGDKENKNANIKKYKLFTKDFEEHFLKEDNIEMEKKNESSTKKNNDTNNGFNLGKSETQDIINLLFSEMNNKTPLDMGYNSSANKNANMTEKENERKKEEIEPTPKKTNETINKKGNSKNKKGISTEHDTLENRLFKYFKLLGQLCAKILTDNRNVDINLHPLFWYLVMSNSGYINMSKLHHYQSVDAVNMNSINKLLEYRRDGKNVEDLHLDFTLLGTTPPIELIPDGSNISVTNENLDLFINKTIQYSLYEGIKFQVWAFRFGFSTIAPLICTNIFDEEEICEYLFGSSINNDEYWTKSHLSTYIKPDHGYTNDSITFITLIEILSEFDCNERKMFLKFCTGTSTLPNNGFSALKPLMKVVKKEDNNDLPSVMTCTNYLKIPDYKNKEKLRNRLMYAINEGQKNFSLS